MAVALGIPRSFLEREYAAVEQAAVAAHPFALPVERDVPIYVCRDPRRTLQEVWVCDLGGKMHFFDADGRLKHSAMVPDFPTKIEL